MRDLKHLKYCGFITDHFGVKILGIDNGDKDNYHVIQIDWPTFNHIRFLEERDYKENLK